MLSRFLHGLYRFYQLFGAHDCQYTLHIVDQYTQAHFPRNPLDAPG